MNNGIISIDIMNYLNVTECEFQKEVNTHGIAKVKGYIDSSYLQMCESKSTSEEWVSINEYHDGINEIIFSGLMNSFEIEYINGYHQVTIEIVGQTYQMDLVENTRIFQSDSTTVSEISNIVGSVYGAQSKIGSNASGSLGHMSVQYMETDWNYLKRIASEKNTFIMPHYQIEGCRYIIGQLNEQRKSIETKNYRIKTRAMSYEDKMKNGVSTSINDESQYIYTSTKVFELGDSINFNGNSLYVYSVKGKLIKEEMIKEYVLKSKNGFNKKMVTNKNIIGLSFDGVVSSVNNDMISVDFNSYESYGSRSYKYATVYSTASGAGWYCMPEEGDTVRVYFPTENENDSYAINSAHISMGDKSPSTKFFRSPTNKEIVFSEKQIKITNNVGSSIVLDDDEGITISSTKGVNISSDKNIDMTSSTDKIVVSAASEVKLEQGDSSITVNDNVKISGEQVHIQK